MDRQFETVLLQYVEESDKAHRHNIKLNAVSIKHECLLTL